MAEMKLMATGRDEADGKYFYEPLMGLVSPVRGALQSQAKRLEPVVSNGDKWRCWNLDDGGCRSLVRLLLVDGAWLVTEERWQSLQRQHSQPLAPLGVTS